MFGIRQVKPESSVVRIAILFEIYEVLDAVVGFEAVNLTIAPYFVRGIDVDAGYVKAIHYFTAIS